MSMNSWPIYNGIYDGFEDARKDCVQYANQNSNAFQNPHEEERWIRRQSEFLIQARTGGQPRFSSLLCESFKFDLTSILDVGGGSGWLFENLVRNQKWKNLKSYTVVELKEVCNRFAKEYNNPIVKFISNDSIQKVGHHDLLNMNSVLQYFEDPDFLEDIISNSLPKIIVVDDTPMTESNSYCSNQRYYGSYLQVKFVSLNSIIKLFKKYDYRLISSVSKVPIVPKGFDWKIEHDGQLIEAPKSFDMIFGHNRYLKDLK